MNNWRPKRFWTAANVVDTESGFAVRLDDRPVKTPAKRLLVVPTRAMAEAIAAEWDAQDGKVRPETMPLTRAANAAIDKVADQFDEVAALLADYGGSDLLCYRAEGPEDLIARQAAGWDPVLLWAETALQAPLRVTSGVAPVAQSKDSLARLTRQVRAMTNFQLTAFHDLVGMSGSLVLALAVVANRLTPDEAWALSRIDETWQAEKWGHDDDAAEIEAAKRRAFLSAARFYRLCE